MLRNSSDGSHIYFVAAGALTPESELNAEGKRPVAGQDNLYGYDTVTEKLKFVATLATGSTHDENLWGESGKGNPGELANFDESSREVQTTPDGNYVVFDSEAQLADDPAPPGPHGAVYRYDFETGELTWVSHGEEGLGVRRRGFDCHDTRRGGWFRRCHQRHRPGNQRKR